MADQHRRALVGASTGRGDAHTPGPGMINAGQARLWPGSWTWPRALVTHLSLARDACSLDPMPIIAK